MAEPYFDKKYFYKVINFVCCKAFVYFFTKCSVKSKEGASKMLKNAFCRVKMIFQLLKIMGRRVVGNFDSDDLLFFFVNILKRNYVKSLKYPFPAKRTGS